MCVGADVAPDPPSLTGAAHMSPNHAESDPVLIDALLALAHAADPCGSPLDCGCIHCRESLEPLAEFHARRRDAFIDAIEADHAAGCCPCDDCVADAAILDSFERAWLADAAEVDLDGLYADRLAEDARAERDAEHEEWARGFEDCDADEYRALGR